MGVEASGADGVAERADGFAALGDPGRLRVVEHLLWSDAMPSTLSTELAVSPSLLAHHLKVLEAAGLIRRRRSEGDRRRTYVQLVRDALPRLEGPAAGGLQERRRVLFVCTANSARSQLARSLWRCATDVPSASAGTKPAAAVSPGALAAAQRRGLPMRGSRPRSFASVRASGDLVVTVCDRAREELGEVDVHWSVPDPLGAGTDEAFDAALAELSARVTDLVGMWPAVEQGETS